MSNLWDDNSSGDGGVDDYQVDPQVVRDMGLSYQGRDGNGNRIWTDDQGHEYTAVQLQQRGDDDAYSNNGGSSSANDSAGQGAGTNLSDYGINNLPQISGAGNNGIGAGNNLPFNIPADFVNVPGLGFPVHKLVLQSMNPATNPVLNSRNIVTNINPVVSSGNIVANPAAALSSTAIVTNMSAATKNFSKQTTDNNANVETHFIDQITGKYLGESKQYYDYVKKNNIQESIVTFPSLKINVRSIPIEDWKAIPQEFANTSNPLLFDNIGVIDDFNEIIDKNKDIEIWTKEDMKDKIEHNDYPENRQDGSPTIVEQGLVVIYDFKNNLIKTIVLPDKKNTISSLDVFSALIKQVPHFGNWLVPPSDWTGAMEDKLDLPEKYYTLARDAKLIVIGFSHTHPAYYFTGDIIGSYNTVEHSSEDIKITQTRLLPDIIATVSVDINPDIKGKKTIIILELLTKASTTKDETYDLPDLNTFCNRIENSIFKYIIKEYNDKPQIYKGKKALLNE